VLALGERTPVLEGTGHFIAANASIIGSVRLGSESSVWFNSVLRGDNDWIEIGARSNIQDGCILHTDAGIRLVVGAGVTVGHRVTLHGCEIGDNTLVGIGSSVLNGARIGNNCVVGAHALVTENKSFPDGSLIIGAPAKVARQLSDEEIAAVRWSADHYVKNAARYLRELTAL
jgi:carbonic anhydrase/acetyltransferase-like protein (isoleucine patch superfamily)